MADPIADQASPEDAEMEVAGDAAIAVIPDEQEASPDLPDVIESPARTPFLEYLKSPILQLVVGSNDSQVTLSVHQDLITQSPYFEQACAELGNSTNRQVDLTAEDPEAVGSYVEYLYRGDYFPRSVDGGLETDPSIPDIDNTGEQLLKHARVYTLADKFFVPALKSLAHTKIHRTTSTARGEIAYARYVYEFAPKDDITLRKPVAAFWATRSHVLANVAVEPPGSARGKKRARVSGV